MVERTPFSPKDVVITRTVARFGNTSYQIAAISSVSVQRQKSVNRSFLSTALLLIIAILVIGYFEWASWIQVGTIRAGGEDAARQTQLHMYRGGAAQP
jgi:cytochrome c-type biogenesis protein CcmH/NrfG